MGDTYLKVSRCFWAAGGTQPWARLLSMALAVCSPNSHLPLEVFLPSFPGGLTSELSFKTKSLRSRIANSPLSPADWMI